MALTASPQTKTPCFPLRLQSQTLPAGWLVVLLVLEDVTGVKALETKLFQEPTGFISWPQSGDLCQDRNGGGSAARLP